MFDTFCEPPTPASLAQARSALDETRQSASELDARIDAAEAVLAQVVQDSRRMISELQKERALLDDEALKTMAYLSPIRRLPTELLRDVFMRCFHNHASCAWVLAAVSSTWRRLALRMPKIWSKIRLVTTQHASADTIRLWLERSGNVVPLDIEILLRVTSSEATYSRRHRRSSLSPPPSPPSWPLSFASNAGIATHYIISHPPIPPPGNSILPPAQTPIIISPPSPGPHDSWDPSHSPADRQSVGASRSSHHWGHIAIYYLVEQMHRWERFIFRFDKQFASMNALKSITGDAPLLKEFEVTNGETAFYPEWQWLPNAPPSAIPALPKLRSLTLQYTPFKWSSPMLRPNLTSLNLRALPSSHLPLDRIMFMILNNPSLECLTLHFQGVTPAILPLSPATLPLVTKFNIGGHYLLSQLVDSLILPSLMDLSLDLDAREPVEDVISNLLSRSHHPPVRHLSIAYGSISNSSAFYYGPSGVIISWSSLLADMTHLESLHIGGTQLEPLLVALGFPDDDTNQLTSWACPRLEALGMRNCHSHNEGLTKLVQMVEARNPSLPPGVSGSGGATAVAVGGVTPARLKVLELYDCTNLGQDVLQWLQSRVDEVVCSDLEFDR